MDDLNQPLRELFDKIDAAELAAMKDRREEESFNLDFKRMEPSREPNGGFGQPSGEPTEKDKETLRVAISGYANAAGGIILWGVDSKKDGNKHDRSRFQAIVPVKDGDRAAVRFHELTATATQPPVSGVVHKAIPVDGGFVVKTFVPASDGGPYRTNEETGQYFRRDADAFRAMQHHEIADMFGRRPRPRLELWWQQHVGESRVRDRRVFAWILGLRNVGRGIARFPCLSLKVHPDYSSFDDFGLDAAGTSGLPKRSVASGRVQRLLFAGGGDDVIHPGQTLHVTRFALSTGEGLCIVKFEIFAEHMPSVEGAFRFWPHGIRHDNPDEKNATEAL